MIDGSACAEGDWVIGLASNGMHTNGYTLAREVVFNLAGASPDDLFEPAGHSFANELLRPHKAYVKALLAVKEAVGIKGMVHITGGGFWDNIPRVLPEGLQARIELGTWEVPAIFSYIAEHGRVERDEMYRVFNMGIGMMVVVAAEEGQKALDLLGEQGEDARLIGRLHAGGDPVRLDG